jgi:hypothetical protein
MQNVIIPNVSLASITASSEHRFYMLMLSTVMLYLYAKCHYTKCQYAECVGVIWALPFYCYAEYHCALSVSKIVIIPNVSMTSVTASWVSILLLCWVLLYYASMQNVIVSNVSTTSVTASSECLFSIVMLSTVMLCLYAKCHFTKCQYAECVGVIWA